MDWHHNHFSDSQTWLNAFNSDSAISDGYARSSESLLALDISCLPYPTEPLID